MMPVGLIATARPLVPLSTIISALGLPAPALVLDAGDPASFSSPTAETWVDVWNGNSFFVGTTGSVDANQPQFEGTIGDFTAAFVGSSTYPNDFTEASNLTFAENWHKNNGVFSLAALVYLPSLSGIGAGMFLFNTCDGTTGSTGITCALTKVSGVRRIELAVARGASPLALASITDVTSITVENAWNLIAIAIDESVGTNGLTVSCNGQHLQSTSTYSSPSSGGTTSPYQVFSPRSTTSGSKIKMFAGWSSRLTTTQLGDLYTRIKQDRQFDLP